MAVCSETDWPASLQTAQASKSRPQQRCSEFGRVLDEVALWDDVELALNYGRVELSALTVSNCRGA